VADALPPQVSIGIIGMCPGITRVTADQDTDSESCRPLKTARLSRWNSLTPTPTTGRRKPAVNDSVTFDLVNPLITRLIASQSGYKANAIAADTGTGKAVDKYYFENREDDKNEGEENDNNRSTMEHEETSSLCDALPDESDGDVEAKEQQQQHPQQEEHLKGRRMMALPSSSSIESTASIADIYTASSLRCKLIFCMLRGESMQVNFSGMPSLDSIDSRNLLLQRRPEGTTSTYAPPASTYAPPGNDAMGSLSVSTTAI